MSDLPRDWSPPIAEQLDALCQVLQQHPRLAGAFVFGDLVRGTHYENETPIGLAIVLEAMGDEADDKLADALRRAFLAIRVEPWLVLEAELPRIADVFPVKLFEIQRYGHHLCGRIDAVPVDSTREQLRLRIEQLARTLHMRRRRQALMRRGPSTERGSPEAASQLWVLLAALDALEGGTEEGFVDRVSEAMGVPSERTYEALAAKTVGALDEVVAALVVHVDALSEPSG